MWEGVSVCGGGCECGRVGGWEGCGCEGVRVWESKGGRV